MRPLYGAGSALMRHEDAPVLQELIAAADPGLVVEIGSWCGLGTTRVFIDELKQRPDANLVCVDHFRGNPCVPVLESAAEIHDIEATFRDNTKDYPDLTLMVMDSVEAAQRFEDASVDLVFIDGDHRYDPMMADIRAWGPKVRLGGILCGHDCESRPRPGMENFVDHDFVDGAHPGVCLAVDAAFAGQARLHAEEDTGSTIWSFRC